MGDYRRLSKHYKYKRQIFDHVISRRPFIFNRLNLFDDWHRTNIKYYLSIYWSARALCERVSVFNKTSGRISLGSRRQLPTAMNSWRRGGGRFIITNEIFCLYNWAKIGTVNDARVNGCDGGNKDVRVLTNWTRLWIGVSEGVTIQSSILFLSIPFELTCFWNVARWWAFVVSTWVANWYINAVHLLLSFFTKLLHICFVSAIIYSFLNFVLFLKRLRRSILGRQSICQFVSSRFLKWQLCKFVGLNS